MTGLVSLSGSKHLWKLMENQNKQTLDNTSSTGKTYSLSIHWFHLFESPFLARPRVLYWSTMMKKTASQASVLRCNWHICSLWSLFKKTKTWRQEKNGLCGLSDHCETKDNRYGSQNCQLRAVLEVLLMFLIK